VSRLDKSLMQHYLTLDQGDMVQALHIWIDGTGQKFRCKTKTLNFQPKQASELPVWNFCGDATGHCRGDPADHYLHPVALYPDPFRGKPNVIVLCEVKTRDGDDARANNRGTCAKVMEMDSVKELKPWFGIEQEYTLLETSGRPLGWPKEGFPGPQGPYYCGVGANEVFGREVMESHYRVCMNAGIKISGENAEVMPGQWEYQVGPCEGIEMGDQLWLSRYLLVRVAEDFGVVVSFDPKPMPGDWNGAGAHCNFSTYPMREDGGIDVINAAVEKLSKRHDYHIKNYDPSNGADNARRLTGLHETCPLDTFRSGVGSRYASVRIPRQISFDGKGYLEDRRPASNCDPYTVTECIIRTCVLDETDEVVTSE